MQQWVEAHASDDPMRLRLRYHGNEDISQAILQIECRRKAASKLPEALGCKAFMFPTGLSAEQSTSEVLARIHADIAGYASGGRHLDLTCGLAIDALEAARCGADVTAVEIMPEIVDAANHNAAALGLASTFRAVNAESERFINDTACGHYDTIFIDPARRGEGGKRLTAIADCMPDVTAMMPRLLAIAPRVIIKASPMLDMTSLADELDRSADGAGAVTAMVAIGTTRECKEVVAVVCRGAQPGCHVTEAITSLPGGATSSFLSDNNAASAPCLEGLPCPGEYLYEPYPAVMKLSAWGSIAALDPSLSQLHPNTHLFVSPSVIDGFPGSRLVIDRVEPLSDKALRSIAREYPKINVSTRNFIISAPELVKRLRVKEGGTMMLYGVRSGESGALAIIVARPD